MGKRKLIDRIRDWFGHLAWKSFIWFNYGGNEELYHVFRDREAFYHWGVNTPDGLREKEIDIINSIEQP